MSLEIAYLAGLFDGEGYITVRGGEGSTRHLTLAIGIAMTDPRGLRRLDV